MYNGIGLSTARGSGTNGYVQRNLAFIKRIREKVEYKPQNKEILEKSLSIQANQELILHDNKKKLEIKVQEMQELMEDQGFDPEEIDEKVTLFRKMLMQTLDEGKSGGVYANKDEIDEDEMGRPITKNSHQMIRARDQKNRVLKDAFSISDDYVLGSSFALMNKQQEEKEKEKAKEVEEKLKIEAAALLALKEKEDMIQTIDPETIALGKILEKQLDALSSSSSESENEQPQIVEVPKERSKRHSKHDTTRDLTKEELREQKRERVQKIVNDHYTDSDNEEMIQPHEGARKPNPKPDYQKPFYDQYKHTKHDKSDKHSGHNSQKSLKNIPSDKKLHHKEHRKRTRDETQSSSTTTAKIHHEVRAEDFFNVIPETSSVPPLTVKSSIHKRSAGGHHSDRLKVERDQQQLHKSRDDELVSRREKTSKNQIDNKSRHEIIYKRASPICTHSSPPQREKRDKTSSSKRQRYQKTPEKPLNTEKKQGKVPSDRDKGQSSNHREKEIKKSTIASIDQKQHSKKSSSHKKREPKLPEKSPKVTHNEKENHSGRTSLLDTKTKTRNTAVPKKYDIERCSPKRSSQKSKKVKAEVSSSSNSNSSNSSDSSDLASTSSDSTSEN